MLLCGLQQLSSGKLKTADSVRILEERPQKIENIDICNLEQTNTKWRLYSFKNLIISALPWSAESLY